MIFGFTSVVLVGGAAAWFVYAHFTDPETVRQLVLEKARVALPGACVQLAAVQGSPLGDCKLLDLTIQAFDSDRPNEEICRLGQLTVSPDRRSLTEGKLLIRKLVVEKPSLHLRRFADGTWNVSRWKSDKPLALSIETEIEIRNGTVIVELENSDLPPLSLTDIQATLKVGPPAQLHWKISMRHLLGQMQSTGDADFDGKKATATLGTVSAFDLEHLRQYLPPTWTAPLAELKRLSGTLQTQATGSADWSNPEFAWNGSVGGGLSDANIDHPALPYPIKKGTFTFSADRTGAEITPASFQMGPAAGQLNVRLPGWNRDLLEVSGKIADIEFSKEIYQSLPPKHRLSWDKLSPEGYCDVEGTIRMANGKPKAVGVVRLHDCKVAFHKFRYPVQGVHGTIELHPEGHFTIDCEGQANDVKGVCKGTVADTPEGPASDIEIFCRNALIDDKLDAALQGPSQAVYRKFKGAGRGDVSARFVKKPSDVDAAFDIEIDLRLTKAQCEWFPYELEDVTGRLSIFPHKLIYRDIVGRSDRGVVRVRGQSVKTTKGVHVETLIRGENISLDDKLQCALPKGWDKTWNLLRPEGAADIDCTAIKPPDGPLELQLKINPARAVLVPTVFPYRLENFVGEIEYRDRRVLWNKLRMAHDRTRWESSGEVAPTEDGGRVTFYGLDSRWLPLDGDFRAACPAKLQSVIDFLKPSKPAGVKLNQFEARWFDDRRPPTFTFDGQVTFDAVELLPAVGLRDVTGGIALVGFCTDRETEIDGNIYLPSITVSRFTARSLTGRLRVANDDVRIHNINGEFYGGKLAGGQIIAGLAPGAGWQLDMRATNANLGQYVRETLRNPPALDGAVDVNIFLQGNSRKPDAVSGKGHLHIRDADVVRLPVIQDLFKIINLRIPNGRAFDDITSDLVFRNKLIVVDDLALTSSAMAGPSLSLQSEYGRIDLETLRMELLLRSRYAKGRLNIPIVSDTLNLANDQIMKVRVHGTLTNPVTTLEPMEPLRRLLTNPLNRRR